MSKYTKLNFTMLAFYLKKRQNLVIIYKKSMAKLLQKLCSKWGVVPI
jgi:hypothetical protein